MRDRLPFQIQVAAEPPINKSQHQQQRTRSNRVIATYKIYLGVFISRFHTFIGTE